MVGFKSYIKLGAKAWGGKLIRHFQCHSSAHNFSPRPSLRIILNYFFDKWACSIFPQSEAGTVHLQTEHLCPAGRFSWLQAT